MNHDARIITEYKTFILAGYVIPCSGTVVAWEFCYETNDLKWTTFYPGIWRITRLRKNGIINYKLVQSNNVTFKPNSIDSGNFICKKFTLPDTDQFTAPAGSVIGLYSNEGAHLLITEKNSSVTTYQVNKNKSNVGTNQDVNYNIAIRVHIGKLHDYVCS